MRKIMHQGLRALFPKLKYSRLFALIGSLFAIISPLSHSLYQWHNQPQGQGNFTRYLGEYLLYKSDDFSFLFISGAIVFAIFGWFIGSMADELKIINEQKNRILGVVAHDLRNPISSIVSFSEILGAEPDLPTEERLLILSRIQNISQLVLRLLGDLLDLSKIEQEKLELRNQTADFVDFVQKTMHVARFMSDKKHQRISESYPSEAIFTEFDPSRMEQAIYNLISNATKFSPEGSEIRVEINSDPGHVFFKVHDSGPGIPADQKQNLFKAFSTTTVKPTGKEKSTGLGLYIVKRIIVQHKGKVWLELNKGASGTTFAFALPRVSKTSIKESSSNAA